jgi:hypothetical protein
MNSSEAASQENRSESKRSLIHVKYGLSLWHQTR